TVTTAPALLATGRSVSMSMPRAGRFLFCIAAVGAVVLVVVPPAGVAGHTRGVRPGQAAGRPFPENATRAEELERLFMRWVRYVGGLKHSTFHHAPLARAFPSYSLVVNKDPAAGDFTSVQAAVDSLPTINLVRVVIKVNAGTYTEKVTISSMRAFITLEGAGADKTIVQWGDTADTPAGPRGRPLGTYGSASFAVNAQYFIARNITFKNTAPVPNAGATGKQAVALRVSADNAAFVGCRFLGAQDTLYDQSGRHYYKDCYIEGSIDFIFGNALSLYEGCHVHAIARDYGALTAQNRQSLLEEGHGVLVRQLQGDGVGGALPGPGLGHLLPRRLRLHLHGRHHRPARLVQLGRPQPRADGVLRAVQVHRARRELLRQGVVVAGAHRRGGQALHLAQLHRRHRVDQDLTQVAFHVVTRTHGM
uniref:Pectinesterase n=1 Tax=Aegilops tauschii subsp. strangulata TaxID=200361 RepID=A0A453AKP4_AEGTS